MGRGMKRSMIISVVIGLLFVVTNLAWADTYSFTDASGTMHFVEDPSLIPKKYRKQSKRSSDDAYSDTASHGNTTTPSAGSLGEEQYSYGAVNICLAGPEKKKGKDYLEFVEFLQQRQIPYATYDMKNNKSLCTRMWCDNFVRLGLAKEMEVHPDDCLPIKLKDPPSVPFYIQGDTVSYALSRYNLSY